MTTQRVLVTGSSGLIGRSVVARLRKHRIQVTGVARQTCSAGTMRADLADPPAAAAIVERVSPTAVVHLAGAATGDRIELHRANVVTTRNLLEAVARLNPPPAVIVAGSAAEYGNPITERVAEDHPTNPVSDYGRSKLEQSTVALHIAQQAGLRLCLIRPFNIVAHGLPPTSALGNMRGQIIAGGESPRKIRCGRLDIVRDFIPLEFACATVVRLLELEGWPACLNVCSGKGIELGDVLSAMASHVGIDIDVSTIPELAAIPAPARIVGDPSLLRALGLWSEPTALSLARVLMDSSTDEERE